MINHQISFFLFYYYLFLIFFSRKTRIKDLRENVYNLLTNCIPPQLILKYMLYDILIYLTPEKQYQAIHWAAHYENRM